MRAKSEAVLGRGPGPDLTARGLGWGRRRVLAGGQGLAGGPGPRMVTWQSVGEGGRGVSGHLEGGGNQGFWEVFVYWGMFVTLFMGAGVGGREG